MNPALRVGDPPGEWKKVVATPAGVDPSHGAEFRKKRPQPPDFFALKPCRISSPSSSST